jgi:hypothetical protein
VSAKFTLDRSQAQHNVADQIAHCLRERVPHRANGGKPLGSLQHLITDFAALRTVTVDSAERERSRCIIPSR